MRQSRARAGQRHCCVLGRPGSGLPSGGCCGRWNSPPRAAPVAEALTTPIETLARAIRQKSASEDQIAPADWEMIRYPNRATPIHEYADCEAINLTALKKDT